METSHLFIRKYENFHSLLLENEIEYLHGADLLIDATFRDANQCKEFRQIWMIARTFINCEDTKIITYSIAFLK